MARRQRIEQLASFSTLSILSSSPTKPPYAPCLLFGNECEEGTGKMEYTFYSLKDKKIVKRQQFFPRREVYSWPMDLHVLGSSHGWLALYDHREKYVYLTNPSLPFYHNHLISDSAFNEDVKKIAMSPAPQIPRKNIDKEYLDSMFFVDCTRYKDVVYFKQRQAFFGLNGDFWRLEAVNSFSIIAGMPASFKHGCYGSYLVESSGNLLAVKRRIDHHVAEDGTILSQDEDLSFILAKKTVTVEVYKLNFEKREWEPVKCIGSNALFVGKNDSFSFCTRDFPYVKSNSVYFADYLGVEIFSLDDDSSELLDMPQVYKDSYPDSQPIWIMVDIDAP